MASDVLYQVTTNTALFPYVSNVILKLVISFILRLFEDVLNGKRYIVLQPEFIVSPSNFSLAYVLQNSECYVK